MLTRFGSKQQSHAPRRFKEPEGSQLVRSRWPLARSGHAYLMHFGTDIAVWRAVGIINVIL